MKKKLWILALGAVLALGSGVAAFTACTPVQEEEPKCEHELKRHAAKEADCVTYGHQAYEECIKCYKLFQGEKEVTEADILIDYDYTKHVKMASYEGYAATCVATGMQDYDRCAACGKIYVDGKEVTAEDITLDVDPSGHHLQAVAEIPSTCTTNGALAHDECSDCHKLFLEGKEVSEESLVTTSSGSHVFADGSLECAGCDAYKMLYNGKYYVIDGSNKQPIKTVQGEGMTAGYLSGNKAPYLAYYPTARMEFATQMPNSGVTVTNDGTEWKISSTVTGTAGTFTRFAYGEGATAYIGRLLMVFDFRIDDPVGIDRLGVKIVNSEANAIGVSSKLIGTNASEENNANRVLNPGTVYRLMYVLEVTDETQLIQIFDCIKGAGSTSIFNLHMLNLDEAATGAPSATLISYGEAENCVLAKEECTHAWKYAISGTQATCQHGGLLAHDYCPQCGLRTADGTVIDNPVVGIVDHNYGAIVEAVASTCTEQGHDAYYHCGWCDQYFNSAKQVIDGVPYLPLAAHTTGEWLTNAEVHWLHCSVCGQDMELNAHDPGPEATDTTPQVCTVCGYVLQSPLSHVHYMSYHKDGRRATCTEDGNIEFYYCDGCNKYFSDYEGENEITTDIIIPAIGHSMTYTAGKAATCTESGNLENYHCENCGKYFSDEAGVYELMRDIVLPAPGHNMTYYGPEEATCYKKGHDAAYYYCSNCKEFFSEGMEPLSGAEIFTTAMTEHHFVNGVCTNDGCTVSMTAAEIKANEASFEAQAATVNPTLLSNPGTWACQTGWGVTAKIENNVLTTTVDTHKTDKKYKAFVRVLPEDPENKGTAYVGVYMWSFDLKVTAALGTYSTEKAKLHVGYFIQNVSGSSLVSIADTPQEFTVGVTYRFSVIVENNDPGHYAQFNIRNTSNSGATVEIFNAYYAFYPEASATGVESLTSVTFMQVVEEAASAAAYVAPQAILPKKNED